MRAKNIISLIAGLGCIYAGNVSAQSQPSAVEIFKLRDMCQENAQKIASNVNSNWDNTTVTDVDSNISLRTLHCYAKLRVIRKLTSRYEITNMLYDGNTKKLLAALDENGAIDNSFMLDEEYKQQNSMAKYSIDDIKRYISEKMATER